jgi:SPFH domain / Band 7 family
MKPTRSPSQAIGLRDTMVAAVDMLTSCAESAAHSVSNECSAVEFGDNLVRGALSHPQAWAAGHRGRCPGSCGTGHGDQLTDAWGIKVTLVEVKDVELPETMRRAMAAQVEAERERRAKVIHALGEKEAAATLGEAAVVLEAHPAAMQLRVLSTMAEVSAERNSTLIFPLPVELLRLVDTMRSNGQPAGSSARPESSKPPATTAPSTASTEAG